MLSWLAPFIFILVLGLFHFLVPTPNSDKIRASMLKNINFYLIITIVVVAFSIVASANYDITKMDYAAWVVTILAIIICLYKANSDGKLDDFSSK